MDTLNLVSYSSINLWLECPKLWEYRYIYEVSLQRSTATVFGLCYHKTLQANYQQKLSSNVDLPITDVLDIFKTEWKNQLRISPPRPRSGISQLDAVTVGKKLLQDYMTEIAPSIQPAEVEQRHYSSIAGIAFVVVPDLITTSGVVIDHKTTSNFGRYKDIRYRPQPTAVAFGLDKQIVFHYHVAVKGVRQGRGPFSPLITPEFSRQYVYIAKTYRLRKDISFWLKKAEKAVEGMKSGVIPPRNCSICRSRLGCEEKERILRARARKTREDYQKRVQEVT